jgi:hypothetical protein
MPLQPLGGYRCRIGGCQSKSNIARADIFVSSCEIIWFTRRHEEGKGVHPAALNFRDCFAFEVAKENVCPLLYVCDDFAKTDLIGGGEMLAYSSSSRRQRVAY